MKNKLIKLIKLLSKDREMKPVLAGYDGFIDEIIQVVDKRYGPLEYDKIKTISLFSDRVRAAAGLSANIELVPVETKIGGNGVIMAKCLQEAGLNVSYCGALGFPEVTPLFSQFANDCDHCISVADPGYTQALEFDDGKLMLGKTKCMNDVTWKNITCQYPMIEELLAEVGMIAFTNWTMLNEMNEIIKETAKILKDKGNSPLLFFDLADPAKRTREDVLEVLSIISNLHKDFKIILGLNENESRLIDEYLEVNCPDLTTRALRIREKLQISIVVIHPLKGAAAANKKEEIWVDGPYTATPKLTTGAGDNFNAGFCLGNLLGMPLEYALLCGVYTSGYYVRNAKSPKREELTGWLKSLVEAD